MEWRVEERMRTSGARLGDLYRHLLLKSVRYLPLPLDHSDPQIHSTIFHLHWDKPVPPIINYVCMSIDNRTCAASMMKIMPNVCVGIQLKASHFLTSFSWRKPRYLDITKECPVPVAETSCPEWICGCERGWPPVCIISWKQLGFDLWFQKLV